MSPIRPSLLTLRPRKPAPQQVRSVSCPRCGKGFEVSQKAMTVRCPSCTSPLRLEDLTLKQDQQGTVATMGKVELLPHTAMMGLLVCGRFINQGRFDGQAVVHGPIELQPASFTTGEIHGRSLEVWTGADLRGKASISPKPLPQHLAPMPSPSAGHRPMQVAPPRRGRP